MTSEEIYDVKAENLSQQGFLFFWTCRLSLTTAYEIMLKWGYEVID